ncbi:MAG: serine protease [Verrucomicrobiota bacterium]
MKPWPKALLRTADTALKQGIVSVAAILMLLNLGCTFRQSENLRAASFTPHAGRRIGRVDAGTFLQSRVALLVSSDRDPASKWLAGDPHVPAGSDLGCAAAIDGRGYFLTAAHCLTHRFVYLILFDSRTTRALRARVVWQGHSRKGQSDLAILHVRRMLDHTLDWADGVHTDEPVMAVGLSWTDKPNRNLRGFEWMGGRILRSSKLKGEEGDFNVGTDVPLQPGDSGGPLVDAEGRLIGINVQGTPPLVHKVLPGWMFPMIAERPNRAWLRETIGNDVARRPSEVAGQFGP